MFQRRGAVIGSNELLRYRSTRSQATAQCPPSAGMLVEKECTGMTCDTLPLRAQREKDPPPSIWTLKYALNRREFPVIGHCTAVFGE